MIANIEAEQQLLGAILTDNAVYHLVSEVLTGEHFADPVHRRIFEICATRINAEKLASPVTLKTLMEGDEGLKALGGVAYLARLAVSAVAIRAAKDYAATIIDAWQRRTVMDAMQRAQEAISGGGEVSEAIGVVEAVTQALSVSEGRSSTISYAKAISEALQDAVTAHKGEKIGINLGIPEIDKLLGPIRGGDFLVLGGAPSMGKTSLALSIANRTADKGVGVAIASLEMTGQSLGFRAMSEVAAVPYSSMLRGSVEDDDFRRILESTKGIIGRPIEIIQPHVKDLHALFAAFRRIQIEMARAKSPLGLIVIDYLQLVRAPGKDRFQVVGAVSQGLKAMAMQLGVPIIALSQLSRDVQSRDDKRPRLTDLRESGQIEQDADFVLFTHREYYYLKREGAPKGKNGKVSDDDRADYEAALKLCQNQMEVICAKQRMGTIGSRTIGFDETTNRIWSLHRQDEEDFR